MGLALAEGGNQTASSIRGEMWFLQENATCTETAFTFSVRKIPRGKMSRGGEPVLARDTANAKRNGVRFEVRVGKWAKRLNWAAL
jgi:hypothetical protein